MRYRSRAPSGRKRKLHGDSGGSAASGCTTGYHLRSLRDLEADWFMRNFGEKDTPYADVAAASFAKRSAFIRGFQFPICLGT